MAYMSVLVMAAGAVVVVAFHFPLVGLAEFFDSLGNASETHHRRFANVLIVNDRNTTTVRLESSPTTPTPAN